MIGHWVSFRTTECVKVWADFHKNGTEDLAFLAREPRGGGTWVFRGVHTFVIKIKKYP